MKHDELQRVWPGFDDLAHGSQAVFRCALEALSRPGRAVALPAVAAHPGVGHPAAAMLLLALLDNDCTLWLSPRLAGSDAEAWLRFHTGCRVVADPAAARFAWLAAGDAWPPLAAFHAGTDLDPDQAATCVIEVDLPAAASAGTQTWNLQGPGIQDIQTLHTRGLPPAFEADRAALHGAFPRGVDVFLASDTHLVGLPRTTALRAEHTPAQEA